MSACAGLLGLDDVTFDAADASVSAEAAVVDAPPQTDATGTDGQSRADSGRWCDLHPDDAGADVFLCEDFDGIDLSTSWTGVTDPLERTDAEPQPPSAPNVIEARATASEKGELTFAVPGDKKTIWVDADIRLVDAGAGQIDVLQVTASQNGFTFALVYTQNVDKWSLERNTTQSLPGFFSLIDTSSSFGQWKHVRLEASLVGCKASVLVAGTTVAETTTYDASAGGPIVVHVGLSYANNSSPGSVRYDNVVVRAF